MVRRWEFDGVLHKTTIRSAFAGSPQLPPPSPCDIFLHVLIVARVDWITHDNSPGSDEFAGKQARLKGRTEHRKLVVGWRPYRPLGAVAYRVPILKLRPLRIRFRRCLSSRPWQRPNGNPSSSRPVFCCYPCVSSLARAEDFAGSTRMMRDSIQTGRAVRCASLPPFRTMMASGGALFHSCPFRRAPSHGAHWRFTPVIIGELYQQTDKVGLGRI